MICRMTKEQREALLNVISAKVLVTINPGPYNIQRSMETEEKFHRLFANEDELSDDVRSP